MQVPCGHCIHTLTLQLVQHCSYILDGPAVANLALLLGVVLILQQHVCLAFQLVECKIQFVKLTPDLSAGITLTQGAKPYLRGEAQWLHLSPFNNRQLGRISTKLGVGGVMANTDTAVPASSLFLTGGDTSVRGYALRSIGRTDRVAMAQGLVLPGRLMWLGALEWQRPTTWGGDAGRVEQTFFVDAGAVSNRLDEQTVFVGTGTGIRFISPVGPMQVDVAYGHQTKEWRLHLFVGIRF